MYSFLFLASAASLQTQPEDQNIIVTASREPVAAEDTAVSATVFTSEEIEALQLPLTSDLIRISPGVTVASTGPKGTQTQVRIRGAEANHSLLFIDGIRFNDPAAGNEARFELLTNDLLSRVELVRGPQSALWGSEAIGGVVAIETADPLRTNGVAGLVEYGSNDTLRAAGQFATGSSRRGLSAGASWLESDGIDSFGQGGERDGFRNLSANLKAVVAPSVATELGLAGYWTEGESEYDGFDPATFRRADTLDSTKNRIGAVRGWGSLATNGWSLLADASYLDSANRNLLDEAPLNSTFGDRLSFGAQVSKQIAGHRLTAAVEHDVEDFRARDESYGGFSNQDRSRKVTAFVGEWRAEWSPALLTDVAVRHDDFSAFADATMLRASVLLKPLEHWVLHGSYGEGIAQPSFYDLYGFFPGSFLGNPNLRPERSKGWEAGLKWTGGRAHFSLTGFTNRLQDEIIDTFDPVTFLSSTANSEARSRRRGVEVEGGYRFSPLANVLINYTLLDAEEQQASGALLVREVRRPKHSANALLTGSSDRFNWGASLSYVGKRRDLDFDAFPAREVILDDYLLASLKLGYRVTPQVEAYVRSENLFDAQYQDVVGYNTPGRTIYAGLRLHLGR